VKIEVKLFAVAKDLAGVSAVEVDLSPPATIGHLRQALVAKVPALAPILPHVLFAVDAVYADDRAEIPAGADVACIPPVSGG
jgi:molybdopterin synthase sulfur carrier subunit